MFEINGYSKEYYIGSKLIGKEILETPDRKRLGYTGRKLETLQEDIMFKKLYISAELSLKLINVK